MTLWTLALRSLRFHARAHLGVLLGATVGAAVLIGALLVGDSVRGSLRDMALARLGKIEAAMATGDRLFRAELATNLKAAPVLALPGTANSADGSRRANRVHVLGVDESFWKLAAKAPAFTAVPPDSVVLNQPLAEQLAAKPGDEVLLRVSKVSALSQDVALTTRDGQSVALRLRVHAVIGAEELGRFSLQANQVAPFNAFVPLALVQDNAAATAKANVIITSRAVRLPERQRQARARNSLLRPLINLGLVQATPIMTLAETEAALFANQLLPANWLLSDAQLSLRPLTNSPALELRTDRIFLDPPAVRAALAVDTNAQPVLTYLATLLRAGTNATAYPMVTAASAPLVPADLRDDEIVVNQWLADQLRLAPGAELDLSYFLPDSGARLTEATNRFRVRAIVPMEMPWADRTLMPDFPGIAKAERIGDWDAGFPLKHSKLVDDAYWKQWRGTPKAFVSLSAGRKMWANRFGDTTAVRFALNSEFRIPNGESAATSSRTNSQFAIRNSQLEKSLLAALKPADFGLVFQPVREQALKASREGQDFGGLFIGFSFFLIIAACVLVALLFQFGVEQRAAEVGTLLALGFTPKQVRWLFLLEGAGLSLLGSLLGAAGGIWYARAMLHALSTVWRDAVGTSDLNFHAEPATLAGGIVGSVLVAVFTLWLALRKQARRPARELLAGGGEEVFGNQFSVISGQSEKGSGGGEKPLCRQGRRNTMACVAVGCLLAALALIGWAGAKQDSAAAGIFFGAGALLLGAAMAFTSAFLSKLEQSEAAANLTLTSLGIRNATRRRRRSLATVAMLACGSFLIVSIGAFRLDEHADATKRASGTGGFALLGESTLPVVQDLNSPAGREFFNLDAKAMTNVSMVPFRVRDGDDASCLNLNRAQKPRLLGVKPELLAERGAFKFAGVAKGLEKEVGWRLLNSSALARSGLLTPALSLAGGEGNEIAAIADEASILWALGKKLGDTLDFTDERGQPFKVRLVAALAGSVLQGNLIISEDEFTARYPGEAGYRFFLVDAPPERAAEVSASLTKALHDFGLELTPTTRRLAQFNAVQNTYLGTFQVLGGLGLLLGSAGLGVVVLRNVLERRGELALLLAVGFRAKALRWLVLSEHTGLLLLGLGCGVVAAAVAVLPALRSGGEGLPLGTLGLTLAGVLVSGFVFTALATTWSLRGRLLDSLRNQ